MTNRVTDFTQDEDTIILETFKQRTGGIQQAANTAAERLDFNRSPHSCINRYYYLTKKAKTHPPTTKEPTLDELIDLANQVLANVKKKQVYIQQLEADLQTERLLTQRLKARVADLEEDQQAFLRLMDKARAIGREETDED